MCIVSLSGIQRAAESMPRRADSSTSDLARACAPEFHHEVEHEMNPEVEDAPATRAQ
jgi:hypothetical protein